MPVKTFRSGANINVYEKNLIPCFIVIYLFKYCAIDNWSQNVTFRNIRLAKYLNE